MSIKTKPLCRGGFLLSSVSSQPHRSSTYPAWGNAERSKVEFRQLEFSLIFWFITVWWVSCTALFRFILLTWEKPTAEIIQLWRSVKRSEEQGTAQHLWVWWKGFGFEAEDEGAEYPPGGGGGVASWEEVSTDNVWTLVSRSCQKGVMSSGVVQRVMFLRLWKIAS